MPYTLIQQFNTQHAHIQFKGPFQGQIVTWDTHLFTVDYYAKQQNLDSGELKQFIEIEALEFIDMKLTVALKVSAINNATIEKTMIMIRQYKKLSVGRHEYGA